RMKAHMSEHVEANQDSMFQASADEVRNQLKDLVSTVEETLADKTDEVFIQIKRDYRAVLGGGDVAQGEVIPRVQRLVRKEIRKTIDGVERLMKIAIGLEVEEIPDDVQDEDEKLKSDNEDDEVSQTVKVENKEVPAFVSNNIKREEAAAGYSPQEASAGETDGNLNPPHTALKQEMEEPQPMDTSQSNAGSDVTSDSDGQADGGDDGVSNDDEEVGDLKSDAASTP
ncbi:MAG: hypothetical protein Q9198_001208, partial [Flavoplaca austrocitrina]